MEKQIKVTTPVVVNYGDVNGAFWLIVLQQLSALIVSYIFDVPNAEAQIYSIIMFALYFVYEYNSRAKKHKDLENGLANAQNMYEKAYIETERVEEEKQTLKEQLRNIVVGTAQELEKVQQELLITRQELQKKNEHLKIAAEQMQVLMEQLQDYQQNADSPTELDKIKGQMQGLITENNQLKKDLKANRRVVIESEISKERMRMAKLTNDEAKLACQNKINELLSQLN